MKIGIYTVIFNEKPLSDVAKFVASLGYEAVEIAIEKRSKHLDLDRVLTDKVYVQDIRNLLSENGLTLAALGNHFDGQLVLGPLDWTTDTWAPEKTPEAKIRYGTEQMKKTARAAAILEVPVVVAFVGSSVWDKWYVFPPQNLEAYQKAWEVFAERWTPILDVYKQEGVKFALEVHPTEIAYNIETAAEAIKVLDNRPDFGFTLDPSHFVWQSIDPVIFIKTFKERIFHVHAKDAEIQKDEVARSGVIPTGPWTRTDRGFRFRTIGWGDVPWRRFLSALAEIGYDSVLSVEHEDAIMSREEGVRKAIEFLNPLVIRERMTDFGSWWNVQPKK